MVTSSRWIICVACWFLSVAFINGQDATEPKPEQIKEWIEELDHPRYQTREAASQHLRSCGLLAIEPLSQAVRGGSLERSSRAMQILTEFAKPRDPVTPNPAKIALTKIASWQVAAASAAARTALTDLRKQESELAVQQLAEHNVVIEVGEMMIANRREQCNHLRIATNFKASSEDVRWVQWLYDVEDAVIQGPQIDDAMLNEVAKMPDLKRLVIYRAPRLTKTGIESLKQARHLQRLELNFLNLGEGSGAVLASLPLQNALRVLGSTPVEEEIEFLRKARPDLTIERSRGGFLGVKCDAGEQVCRIDGVEPGTAAEAGGLMVNDVILKLESDTIQNYDGLRNAIGKYPPGQDLKVEINRRGELMRLTIRLGETRP